MNGTNQGITMFAPVNDAFSEPLLAVSIPLHQLPCLLCLPWPSAECLLPFLAFSRPTLVFLLPLLILPFVMPASDIALRPCNKVASAACCVAVIAGLFAHCCSTCHLAAALCPLCLPLGYCFCPWPAAFLLALCLLLLPQSSFAAALCYLHL